MCLLVFYLMFFYSLLYTGWLFAHQSFKWCDMWSLLGIWGYGTCGSKLNMLIQKAMEVCRSLLLRYLIFQMVCTLPI